MVRAIDYLCNHFTPESIRKNYLEGEEHEVFDAVGRAGSLRGYQPEEFLSMLGSLGVERVLIPSLVSWNYWEQRPVERTTVEEVVEVSDGHPDRVSGLYGVNPRTRMDGVAELERAVREHGFRGIHVHPHGFGFPPNHAYYFPFYAKCAELGVTAVVSMGHTLDLMPNECGRPIHLDEVALYFPELRIVCAHTGWPWVEEAVALATKHPNMFLGTSAYAPKYWKPEMVRFLDSRRGRDKVLWGTDWPLLQHEEALQQIEALELREESKAKLLYDNAARVFGLE